MYFQIYGGGAWPPSPLGGAGQGPACAPSLLWVGCCLSGTFPQNNPGHQLLFWGEAPRSQMVQASGQLRKEPAVAPAYAAPYRTRLSGPWGTSETAGAGPSSEDTASCRVSLEFPRLEGNRGRKGNWEPGQHGHCASGRAIPGAWGLGGSLASRRVSPTSSPPSEDARRPTPAGPAPPAAAHCPARSTPALSRQPGPGDTSPQ